MAFLLGSCSKGSLDPRSYVKWVEDPGHGLSVNKQFDDMDYQLLYKPVNYILAKEYINGALKKEDAGKRQADLGNMQYFTFRIKAEGANELMSAGIRNEDQYYQRLEYFMGGIQDDIYLVEDQDTVPCSMCHFERNYGLAPYNTFDIAFNHSVKKEADKVFVYEDKFLGTGKIMIRVKAGDIQDAPDLNWNN